MTPTRGPDRGRTAGTAARGGRRPGGRCPGRTPTGRSSSRTQTSPSRETASLRASSSSVSRVDTAESPRKVGDLGEQQDGRDDERLCPGLGQSAPEERDRTDREQRVPEERTLAEGRVQGGPHTRWLSVVAPTAWVSVQAPKAWMSVSETTTRRPSATTSSAPPSTSRGTSARWSPVSSASSRRRYSSRSWSSSTV